MTRELVLKKKSRLEDIKQSFSQISITAVFHLCLFADDNSLKVIFRKSNAATKYMQRLFKFYSKNKRYSNDATTIKSISPQTGWHFFFFLLSSFICLLQSSFSPVLNANNNFCSQMLELLQLFL